MTPRKANIIKASYRLMQKVGTGAVSEEVLERCEAYIKSGNANFLPWALKCVKELNAVLERSVNADVLLDDVMRQDLIAPIMQLKASGAMFQNTPLSQIASMLLHFLESIPRLDQDVVEIVKANETVLTAFVKDSESETLTPQKRQLIQELQAACNRYATKNSLPAYF